LDELFDFEADLAEIHVKVLEDVGGDPGPFLDQPQQHVLGADIFVVEPLRFLVRQLHDFSRAVSKSLVHRVASKGRSQRREIRAGAKYADAFRIFKGN
jgi:hypothetical protein